MNLPPLHDGDTLLLFNGESVRNNGASDDGAFVNVTGDDGYGIPVHRDTRHIREVWRGGAQIWPPETVQLEMFGGDS